MTERLIIDLFCGLGGCSVGYERSGFRVIGVDIVRQPEYPFEFVHADALSYEIPAEAVAVHASPPCKTNTVLRHVSASRFPTLFDPHPDLIPATRAKLIASGLPYVIENVVGADLIDPVIYCGSSFGLMVRRHRLFEANWDLQAPPCDHKSQPVVYGVYGTGGAWTRTAPGGGGGKSQARTPPTLSGSRTQRHRRGYRRRSRPPTQNTSAIN